MSTPYLLGLRLAGRRVLVVGGGAVALRRAVGLLEAGADVLVVAPEATPALEALAQDGRLRWERRAYASGDLAGAWLVHACTDDPDVNAGVVAEAESAGTWCVRADDATRSPAWTAATGRHGALTFAVLAGGDPRRAARLRDAVLARLDDGTLDSPSVRERARGGWVALVGGGPGHPGLITVRGHQLLREADVVVADRLAPLQLLDTLGPDVEVVDAAKVPYGRSMPQEEINRVLVERALEGRRVVRLKGGDPFVFGRGGEELLACVEAGVPCEVVPGVSSALAAPAAAGVPVTHRGVAQEFTVVSCHVPPGHPRSTVDWTALGRLRGTLVLLMAVERLGPVADALVEAGRDPATPVAVVQDGTLPSQRRLVSTLARLAEDATGAGVRPPAVVVVGDVVAVSSALQGVTDADRWGGQG